MKTITELKIEITKLQQENLKCEGEVNILYEENQDIKEKAKKTAFNLTAKERRIQEIKRSVYALSVQLEKRQKEMKIKARKAQIQIRIDEQPTFDSIVNIEMANLVNELKDMNFTVGREISKEELWGSYERLVNQTGISKASAIRQEAITRYTYLLSSLIEKELDGGAIDLIEKRNLKLPIQNFLSNPIIKNELQI